MIPKLSIVVATASNGVIGNKNQLPWHLPADLKYFKQLTWGKPIIMGRKTFESIRKPLPGRRNIVVSRQWSQSNFDIELVHSLQEAITYTQEELKQEEIYIIGGQQLFEQALSLVDRIYLTKIHHAFTGDAYFPELDMDSWHVVSEENHSPDEKNPYAYSFFILQRTLKR